MTYQVKFLVVPVLMSSLCCTSSHLADHTTKNDNEVKTSNKRNNDVHNKTNDSDGSDKIKKQKTTKRYYPPKELRKSWEENLNELTQYKQEHGALPLVGGSNF